MPVTPWASAAKPAGRPSPTRITTSSTVIAAHANAPSEKAPASIRKTRVRSAARAGTWRSCGEGRPAGRRTSRCSGIVTAPSTAASTTSASRRPSSLASRSVSGAKMRLAKAPATVMAVSAAIRRSVNHLATTVKAAP
jgi:hypothetical protein